MKSIPFLAIVILAWPLLVYPETPSLDNPTDNKDYSGYYVMDGKMYFYDQKTGSFNPTDEGQSKKSDVGAADMGGPDEGNAPLLQSLKEEEGNFERSLSKQKNYAYSAQADDGDESSCTKWGSPLLDKKTYQGKEECDNDLESYLDGKEVAMDKYIQNFENKKTSMMIYSNLEDYNKLKEAKLLFPTTTAVIQKIRKQGCICMQ